MEQEELFDSIARPWRYDPSIGVVIASQRHGEGDGAYRYVTDSVSGNLIVEINPCPAAAIVFQQRKDAWMTRIMELVPARDAEDTEDVMSSSNAEQKVFVKEVATNALPPRQRRVTNDALARCTITTLVRPTTGRTDLLVVTPDGRSFRSKVAALRYMEGCKGA